MIRTSLVRSNGVLRVLCATCSVIVGLVACSNGGDSVASTGEPLKGTPPATAVVFVDLTTSTTRVVTPPGAPGGPFRFRFDLRSVAAASTAPLFLRPDCGCLTIDRPMLDNPATDPVFEAEWKPLMPDGEEDATSLDVVDYNGAVVGRVEFRRPGRK